jgi:hypothetical protein
MQKPNERRNKNQTVKIIQLHPNIAPPIAAPTGTDQ